MAPLKYEFSSTLNRGIPLFSNNDQFPSILAQMVVAVTYQVNLHCPECAHKIRKILVGVPEVHSVDVNFEKSEVKVVGTIDAKKIHDRIETLSKKKVETIKVEADFKETIIVEKIVKETKEPILRTTTVKVHMHCDQCEYDLRRKLLKHQGIYNVKTDMKSQSLTVDGTIEPDKLLAYIHKRVHKHAEIMSTKQAKKEAKPEEKSKKDKEEKKMTAKIEEKEEKKMTAKIEEKEENKEAAKIEEKEENKEAAKMQERPTKVIDIKDVKEVEEKLKESNTPYIIHYVYAPQWFSDENPTSCSIM
ncbi:hypothetical protein Nepgr_002513 [Nepenthes gracilis]|uniref:HMA domain-containing protein n=1 Tax=Nepenthes gracilis TaxID=150966 RepID=A0AAD3P6E4_NEPGR|nr:hypothetical protein Nepgr_002513 [Nepenthes gracilis]